MFDEKIDAGIMNRPGAKDARNINSLHSTAKAATKNKYDPRKHTIEDDLVFGQSG
jgi:hypothetical protein